jgi:hypothetical protein
MPSSESAAAAEEEEAVAEIVAAVADARPAIDEAGLGVGDLVATMRVEATLSGLLVVPVSSTMRSSSESCVEDGFLAVVVGFVGLAVSSGSSSSSVVVVSRARVAGAGNAIPGFSVGSGDSSPSVTAITCVTIATTSSSSSSRPRCRRTRCAPAC